MTDFSPREACIRTADGSYFYYDGGPADTRGITTANVAHGLALTCRYGGHVPRFYSVAQHSVLVTRLCADKFWPWALFHDAGEFVLPDVPRPAKAMLPDYVGLEHAVLDRVAYAYGLPPGGIPAEVKHADLVALCAEAWLLYGVSGIREWGVPVESDEVAAAVEELTGMRWWGWRHSKRAFIHYAEQIIDNHGLNHPEGKL